MGSSIENSVITPASSQLGTPPPHIGAFILQGDNQEILSVLSLKWKGDCLNRSLGPFHSSARVSHPMGSIRFRWQEMINGQSVHQSLGVLHLSLQVIEVGQPRKEIVALNFNWETLTGQKEFLGVVVIMDILQSRIIGTLLLNLERKNLSHNKPIGLILLGWTGYNPRRNASQIPRLLDLRWIFFGDPELNDNQNRLLGSVDFDFQRIHPTAGNDTFFGSISMLHRCGMPPANLSWSYDRNPPPLNPQTIDAGNQQALAGDRDSHGRSKVQISDDTGNNVLDLSAPEVSKNARNREKEKRRSPPPDGGLTN